MIHGVAGEARLPCTPQLGPNLSLVPTTIPGPSGSVQGDGEILRHQSAEEAGGAESGRDREVCGDSMGHLALGGAQGGWLALAVPEGSRMLLGL